MSRIRVLLVDDNDMIRMSLSLYLSTWDDIQVVGEANNGQEAIELTPKLQPNLILMDLMMPRMDGIQATAHIHQHFPQIRILVLTSGTDFNHIEAAQRAGAAGYVLKNIQASELIEKIRKLCQ